MWWCDKLPCNHHYGILWLCLWQWMPDTHKKDYMVFERYCFAQDEHYFFFPGPSLRRGFYNGCRNERISNRVFHIFLCYLEENVRTIVYNQTEMNGLFHWSYMCSYSVVLNQSTIWHCLHIFSSTSQFHHCAALPEENRWSAILKEKKMEKII